MNTCMAERIQKKRSWLLVDSFVGALSDFADETVVETFSSRSAAVSEVKSRIRLLEKFHREIFEAHEVTLPSNREVELELSKSDRVKYCSSDGCRYSWQLYKLDVA